MRVIQLIPLALATSAFVIPDEETRNALTLEKQELSSPSFFDQLRKPQQVWEEPEDGITQSVRCEKTKFEDIFENNWESVSDTATYYSDKFETAFDGEAWLNSAEDELVDLVDHPPPHHGGPGHGKPGKRPHHPPHHHKPNMTVWELIDKSKYTTKLAAAISEYDDLVELLNGTTANFTVFAPTNKAFEKIPKHAPKPSKEFLKKVLTYHVSPEFYPAGRVLVTRTIPTALEAELIGKVPQRLSTQIGLRGLTVNFYARIVAINIFGTNGVIHGIDSFLLPPPKAVDAISLFPGHFSTLELGLVKTGLFSILNDTTSHNGGTIFAPSNHAFAMLGPRANAFLFSKFGEKYLKALLLYHLADNTTLYSDAIYKIDADDVNHGNHGNHGHHRIPKGFFHVDLESALEGKPLSIDVARYGRLITMKINGFTRVALLDGIVADGVIHVVPNVLIPPKAPGMAAISNEDISVEELKERLQPYVVDDEVEYEQEL